MPNFTILVIVAGCSAAFLIQDFGLNQTSTLNGQHATVEESFRDLVALIVEEKRSRLKLESRLNDAENKITQMNLYNVAVSNELENEKNELKQMKTVCNDLRLEMNNITAGKTCVSQESLESIKTDVENITNDLTGLKLEDKRHSEEVIKLNRTLLENIANINGQLQITNDSFESIRDIKRHSFSVYYPDRKSGSGTTPVKFLNLFYNDFNVFGMTTGIFTCKHSGLYFLTYSILKSRDYEGSVFCRMHKNGQYISAFAASIADGGRQFYTSGANSILYQLQEGDEVYISGCNYPSRLQPETSFTVFLLSPEGKSVGFSVNYPNTATGSDPLKFKMQEYNDHYAYNVTSGMFVCNIPGIYVFTLSILRTTGTETVFSYFNKNGRVSNYAYTFASSNSAEIASARNSILYYLHTGDKAYISECRNISYLAAETSFMGFLVSQTY